MGTDAVTPSKSTHDLIQATRPGFPRGLRVRVHLKFAVSWLERLQGDG
jgi:hypothetical protein